MYIHYSCTSKERSIYKISDGIRFYSVIRGQNYWVMAWLVFGMKKQQLPSLRIWPFRKSLFQISSLDTNPPTSCVPVRQGVQEMQ